MIKQKMITIGVLFALISMAFGCSKDPKKGGLITQKLQTPTYYKHIPADTPYFFSDLSPVPYAKIPTNLYTMYAPLISSFRQEMINSTQSTPVSSQNKQQRAVLAVLDELNGNFSPDGMSKLGINARASFALYGVGMWPVVRIPLSDRKKFEAMIKRVETKVGESLPMTTYKGVKFRQISDSKAVVPLIITDDAVMFGLTNVAFKNTYLDYVLGKVKPKKSMFDANKLLAVQKTHKYKPYMTGYVDIAGMTSSLIDKNASNLIFQSVKDVNDFKRMPEMSTDCKTEYLEFVKAMPRMVIGYTELSSSSMTFVTGMENTNGVAKDFSGAKSAIPLNGTAMSKEALGYGGFGIDVSKLVNVLKVYSDKISAAPFKCANLSDLNKLPRTYNQMSSIPAIAKTIKGGAVYVGNVDVDFQNQRINDLSVGAVVRTSDPQGALQAVKALNFLPSLQSLVVKTDGVPVEVVLPSQFASMIQGLPKVYIVMTTDAIGVVLGEATSKKLAAALKQPLVKNGPVIMATYDIQGIIKLLRKNTKNMSMSESEKALFETMLSSYSSFGPSTLSFDVNGQGFFFQGRTTFVGK